MASEKKDIIVWAIFVFYSSSLAFLKLIFFFKLMLNHKI